MLEAIEHRASSAAGAKGDPPVPGEDPRVPGEDLRVLVERRPGRQVVMAATLCDEAAQVSLMLDGSIDNARELRAELERRGHRFSGSAEAELVLRAYQHWDKDAMKQLRGPFALALWDSRKERLLLARDRFGERPLYLAEKSGLLFFASEPKALLRAPGMRAEADPQSLRDYVRLGYLPGPRSMFRGIRALAPGSFALWQCASLHEQRYWFPPDRNPRPEGATPAAGEAVEGFIAQLDQAVGLAPDAGVLLSGGLDSAMIVALLSGPEKTVRTFALGIEGDRRSELARAASLAKHFGASHREVLVGPGALAADLKSLVAARDAPISRPSELAMHRLAKEAGRSARVLLSGDGCDEVLGGYRRHAAERLAEGFSRRLEERRARWARVLLPGQAVPAKDEGAGRPGGSPPFDADPRASSLRRVLYFDQTASLPGRLLERNDRIGARAAVQLRMPFLDHRLVEYVSALPDDRRVRGLATKWILRQAGRRLIPPRPARRQAGLRLPLAGWLRSELRESLLDHLQGASSTTRRYCDAASLDRVLKEHLEGKYNHEIPLWTLFNLEIWHRLYGVT
jgi:asparagine synthase (glutamine-hydrolysing)